MSIQTESNLAYSIKTYNRIYTLVFVLSVPFFAFIFSLWIFFVLQANIGTFKELGVRNETILKKEKEISTIVQDEIKKKFFSDTNVNIIIKNGIFEYKNNDILVSVQNLLMYKGLIVPRIAVIDTKIPLQDKKFFSQPQYDIRELDRYMKHIVFGFANFSVPSKETENQQKSFLLPIPGFSIRTYFSLDCLWVGKVESSICDYYLRGFLENMNTYDLSHDYDGLGFVFEKIKYNKNYQDDFCKKLQQYVLYTYDTNQKLANIMDSCGNNVAKIYDLLRSFFLVQEDLSKQTPSLTVFIDKNINAYKLLSIQQQIFLEINKKRFNQPRIAMYLQYVEELLKRNAIEHVYKDEIFLFNNSYLSTVLNSPAFATSLNKKEEIRLLQQRISDINKGSDLKGYIGLEKQIFNKKLLILLQDAITGEVDMITDNTSLLDIFVSRFSFDSLRILDQQQLQDNTIFISGKLLFGQDQEIQYPVTILFSYYMGNFIVKEIFFTENTGKINQSLQAIVEKNKLTLPQVYDYLKKNMELFSSEQEEVTLCDKIRNAIPSTSKCDQEQIDVEVSTKSGLIVYSFVHTSGKVLRLYLTDKERERAVWDVYSGVQTNEISIIPYIKEVIAYDPPLVIQEIFDDITQAERVAIEERFATYLTVSSTKIFKKNSQVFVAFTLKGIDFVCTYDIPTFTIKQLFFRKLGPSQGFFSFNLTLDAKNIDILEQFTKDPLKYLEKVDPKLVLLYKKS